MEAACARKEPEETQKGLVVASRETATGDSPHFSRKNSPKNLIVMPARAHPKNSSHAPL